MLYYVPFLLASHLGLLLIFKLTTYHRTFRQGLPILLGFSALVGYLLYAFGFGDFVGWHIGLSVALLMAKAGAERRDAQMLLSIFEDGSQEQLVAELSLRSTTAHYWLGVLIYETVLAVAFLASEKYFGSN